MANKGLNNKQRLENQFKNARGNLLLVVALTVINIVLLVTNSDSYFLFSAFIPYALASIGMMICGMYPKEFYGEDYASWEFFGTPVFVGFLVVAIIIVALYLISWIFSKNNKGGWLIFALVIFSADTLGMFVVEGISFESIIDVVFHVWVIALLINGVIAWNKLKKLPAEEIEDLDAKSEDENLENSEIIRRADTEVKARILIEDRVMGHRVVYRRVKRTNELVIDGMIYDELEALVEQAHSLTANIDGHLIEAGFDGKLFSYIKLDGEIVAKKVRLV